MTAHADYGVDRPDIIVGLSLAAVVLLLVGTLLLFPYHFALAELGLVFLAIVVVFVVANPLKPRAAADLIDSLRLEGTERVLDVGCGRGLWLITAAKRLTTGRAVGVDIWNARLQSGNSPEKTMENAELEGVADRVEVQNGRAEALPFEDSSFDVVLSSFVIHHVPRAEWEKALGEMVRVLRPGGRLAMLEVAFETNLYAESFRRLGLTEIRTAWSRPLAFMILRSVTAKKPLA